MTLYDWLLFFHVAGVFAVVSALVVVSAAVIAETRSGTGELRLVESFSRLTGALFGVGGLAILVFGIWLVIHVDGYDITDGWIIGGLILWLVAATTGSQAGKMYGRAAAAGGERNDAAVAGGRSEQSLALLLHAVSVAAILLALLLMIFKPGA